MLVLAEERAVLAAAAAVGLHRRVQNRLVAMQ